MRVLPTGHTGKSGGTDVPGVPEIAAYAEHLARAEFFEAHEVLEGRWLAAAEPERTFLKGLIHVAVALYHHSRGNRHGARVKHASAVRYLTPYTPEFGRVDLEALLQALEKQLEAVPPSAAAPGTARSGPAGVPVTFRDP